ncbi:MAG: YegP family protein [Burkholderiales bacterium]|jgi:uncharacterized protein YegP (UPF0339 family)|nr:YegP family protein [Burkholderiales bacterium]
MSGYFELKSAAGAQFMFNLKAGNHEVSLTSERYATKVSAENGIASVKENAVIDERFQRKVSKDNAPYFVLLAANGQTLGKSEMHSSSKAMEGGIASVKANAPGAPTKVLEEK